MALLDLSSLVSEALATADSFGDVVTSGLETASQGRALNEDRARAAKTAGEAAAHIAEADIGQKAQQAAINKSIAARLGTDSTEAGWIIGKMGEQVAVADAQMNEAMAQIQAKDSISFIDNPLGWIAAQATINTDIRAYNNAETVKKQAQDTANMRAKMTTDALQNNNGIGTVVTQSYIDAAKILGAHKYNAEAFEATGQALRWNMEGIQLAANASKDRLQVLFSANSAMMQEKQYQNELARLAMAKQEFNLRKQAHQEKIDEDSLILKYVQKGFFNLTGRQMEGARAKDALILFKSKQPDVMEYFNSGMQSFQISEDGKTSVISLSPFDAATLAATNKVHNLPPPQTQVLEKLVSWRRNFESPAVQNALQLDKKDKTSVERAFNNYVNQQRELESGNTRPDSIFAPADMKQTAAVNPTVAALPIWKNVLAPAAATGVDINDPNVAFGVVVSAMQKGTLSYADAVDLSTVYAAGLDINNQSRNFIAMGLGPVRSYNTGVSVPGQMGKTTVNMVDNKALATALNKAMARYTSLNVPVGVNTGINIGRPGFDNTLTIGQQ